MRNALIQRISLLPVLLAAIVASACEGSATAPTPEPPSQSIEVYSGPLDPGGRNTYLFTLQSATTVQAMLVGAVLDNPLRTTEPVLTLEFGFWDGSRCVELLKVDTTPQLTAVLHRYFEPGSYCAIVSDSGSLTEAVGIAIRLVAPALINTGGSPGTQVFASTITPGGTATRTFEVSQGGNVDIRLTNLTPVDVVMNLGIGVVSPDGSGCRYSRIISVTPASASQLSVRADAGDYCTTLFDIGNLTGQATFSMTIAHP